MRVSFHMISLVANVIDVHQENANANGTPIVHRLCRRSQLHENHCPNPIWRLPFCQQSLNGRAELHLLRWPLTAV